jgi:hypothetical protein
MAKRRYDFDESKVQRYLAEGRGVGQLASYKPWLTVHDVPSSGRVSRIQGWHTGRIHHLLSDGETGLFLLFDWEDAVADIREQFPLDRDVTRQIAVEIGVPHPHDNHTQTDLVMTTDFLIDAVIGGKACLLARTFKRVEDLDDERTIAKFEIERRYWAKNGVDWGIVTDAELPAERIQNLHWLHSMRSLEGAETSYAGYWEDRINTFCSHLAAAAEMSIKGYCRWLEQTLGFQSGEGLTVIRYLLANKRLYMDLDRKFDPLAKVTSLDLVQSVQPDLPRSA